MHVGLYRISQMQACFKELQGVTNLDCKLAYQLVGPFASESSFLM